MSQWNSFVDCTELLGRYQDEDYEPYGMDRKVAAGDYAELRLQEIGTESPAGRDDVVRSLILARFE